MAVDRGELQRLIPRLRRYARGLTGDADSADDLVQDCLLRALDRETQYRGGSLAGWLYAILTNAARSRLRAERRRPTLTELDDMADGGGADAAARMTILTALSAIPAEQREPLLLVAVEGRTYQETADILDIPIGTVMSRIARGRAELADRLEGNSTPPIRRMK